jgi:hypothetical protein
MVWIPKTLVSRLSSGQFRLIMAFPSMQQGALGSRQVSMIEKQIAKRVLGESQAKQDLRYWLSRPASERIAAVELLRRQHFGSTARLQRIARIVEREHR